MNESVAKVQINDVRYNYIQRTPSFFLQTAVGLPDNHLAMAFDIDATG